MATATNVCELYKAFRSLELAFGFFGDILASFHEHGEDPAICEAFAADKADLDILRWMINPYNPRPTPCDRPPFCQISGSDFRETFDEWANGAGAASRVLSRYLEGKGDIVKDFLGMTPGYR